MHRLCRKININEQLEAFAIMTAIGPTYFRFQFEHLRRLAVKLGIEERTASSAIRSMLEGAVMTYFDSGLNYAEVIDLVPNSHIFRNP